MMGIKRDLIIAKSGPRIGGGYYSVQENSGLFIYMGKVEKHNLQHENLKENRGAVRCGWPSSRKPVLLVHDLGRGELR